MCSSDLTSDAIKTAVELASRYINDRKLPDKAIDVIDEAGAAQHLVAESKRRKTIGAKEIEAVVAKIARIPPKNVSKDDAETIRSLETNLKRVVFGQDAAIDAQIAKLIDDERDAFAIRIFQHVTDQRRFPGAEKTGHHSGGNFCRHCLVSLFDDQCFDSLDGRAIHGELTVII